MLIKILKYIAAFGCGLLTLSFAFLMMMLSGGIAGLPGQWIMDSTNNELLKALGLIITLAMAIGSMLISFHLTLVSLMGCAQCFTWAHGGLKPSLKRCFQEATKAYPPQ